MSAVLNSIISPCWIIFVGYWCVSAFRLKPAVERQSVSSSMPYRVPLTLGVLLMWFPDPFYPFNLPLGPRSIPFLALGDAFCIVGLLMALWSRWKLADNWSSNVTFRKGHELIQEGPYRVVRHPIYTGLLLMCMGTAIAGANLHSYLGFLLICVGCWIKLKQEESLLLRHFPGDYPSYQHRVKALIPFLI
jgi:protein-S-isoprenylcysteine O-methyltransferase Ste14